MAVRGKGGMGVQGGTSGQPEAHPPARIGHREPPGRERRHSVCKRARACEGAM